VSDETGCSVSFLTEDRFVVTVDRSVRNYLWLNGSVQNRSVLTVSLQCTQHRRTAFVREAVIGWAGFFGIA